MLGRHFQPYESNSMRTTKRGDVWLYVKFGGQRNTDDCIGELRETCDTYGHLVADALSWEIGLPKDLSRHPEQVEHIQEV